MKEEILTDFFDWTDTHMSFQTVQPLNQNKSQRDFYHHSSFLIPYFSFTI